MLNLKRVAITTMIMWRLIAWFL